MKKYFLLLALVLPTFLSIKLDAQSIKTREDGNIVAYTPDFSDEPDDARHKMSIRSSRAISLYVLKSGSTYSVDHNWGVGILSRVDPLGGLFNSGVNGSGHSTTVLNSGRSYGARGTAGNTTSGYNYGVAGLLIGEQNGTGIYGGFAEPEYIPGRYAGYFEGDTRVIGELSATVTNFGSDLRYKQNVATLSSRKTSVLNTLLELNPVEYHLKQVYIQSPASGRASGSVSDTTTATRKLFDENSQMFRKKHFGLVAQEVQKLYPDLVYEDADGYLGINYIGLIPLLITSIKELKEEIDILKAEQSTNVSDISNIINIQAFTELSSAELYQNIPNPFSQTTQIQYYLPASIKTAFLCIYDMQGKQLKQYLLTQRGEGFQQIFGNEFTPGMYLYSMIADGKEVDTKRMILTE